MRIVRIQRLGQVDEGHGGRKVPIGFLEAREAHKRMQIIRIAREGFAIERPRLRHLPLVLQAEGEVGQKGGVAILRKLKGASKVMLADDRPVPLGERQAEKIMGLSVIRREADRVPGVADGAIHVPPAQEQQRQLIDGPEIVGRQANNALDERRAGVRTALALADFIQDPERPDPRGGELQNVKGERFGLLKVAALSGRRRLILQRQGMAMSLRGAKARKVQAAAARSAEAAAAGAKRPKGDCGWSHDEAPGFKHDSRLSGLSRGPTAADRVRRDVFGAWRETHPPPLGPNSAPE